MGFNPPGWGAEAASLDFLRLDKYLDGLRSDSGPLVIEWKPTPRRAMQGGDNVFPKSQPGWSLWSPNLSTTCTDLRCSISSGFKDCALRLTGRSKWFGNPPLRSISKFTENCQQF
jgi:hypothetical protein